MPRFLCPAAAVVAFALSGCVGDTPQDPVDPSYEHVEKIMRRSCAISSSCHAGDSSGQARMNLGIQLEECYPVTAALLVPSQEYPPMQRVAPGDPDHSYVMYKIDGAHDSMRNLIFTPDPAWVAGLGPDAGRYVLHDDAGALSFGVIMPQVSGESLPPNDIISIREWIAAGAPHPDMIADCDAGPPEPDLGPRDAGPHDSGAADATSTDAATDADVDATRDATAADAGMDASADGSIATD